MHLDGFLVILVLVLSLKRKKEILLFRKLFNYFLHGMRRRNNQLSSTFFLTRIFVFNLQIVKVLMVGPPVLQILS